MKDDRRKRLLMIARKIFPSSKQSREGNIILNFPSLVGFINVKGNSLEIKLSENMIKYPDLEFNKILEEKLALLKEEIEKYLIEKNPINTYHKYSNIYMDERV